MSSVLFNETVTATSSAAASTAHTRTPCKTPCITAANPTAQNAQTFQFGELKIMVEQNHSLHQSSDTSGPRHGRANRCAPSGSSDVASDNNPKRFAPCTGSCAAPGGRAKNVQHAIAHAETDCAAPAPAAVPASYAAALRMGTTAGVAHNNAAARVDDNVAAPDVHPVDGGESTASVAAHAAAPACISIDTVMHAGVPMITQAALDCRSVDELSTRLRFASLNHTSDATNCWWCTGRVPDGMRSKQLPVDYDRKRNAYKLVGNFCSWECSKTYSLSAGDSGAYRRNTHLLMLIAALLRSVTYDCADRMPAPHVATVPDRTRLVQFGGTLTNEQLQAGLDHGLNTRACTEALVHLGQGWYRVEGQPRLGPCCAET